MNVLTGMFVQFVPLGPVHNTSQLGQLMAGNRYQAITWENVRFSSLTHMCVTRPQYAKRCRANRDWIGTISWKQKQYELRPPPWVDFNTLRPRQNGRRFADHTFKRIFLNENARISIKISLKYLSQGPINNNTALAQIMAWRRSGEKPLSEPMIVYWRIYASLGLNE